MTAAEPPAQRIQAALSSTTPVVDKVPISGEVRSSIDSALRGLVRGFTDQLCDNADSEARLLHGITVLAAIGELAQELQQGLFVLARDAKISEQRIGQACGVTQQAVNKRLQRK